VKEYHYIVKWTEEYGWQIDADTESSNFPNGTVYDTEEGWQHAYLGDGEYNGREEELCEALSNALEILDRSATDKECKLYECYEPVLEGSRSCQYHQPVREGK